MEVTVSREGGLGDCKGWEFAKGGGGYIRKGARCEWTHPKSNTTPLPQVAKKACQPPLHHYPPSPMSFPTPGKTVPHHPLGDGCQVTPPPPPMGDQTTTVHAYF